MVNLFHFMARRAARRLIRKVPMHQAADHAARTAIEEGKKVLAEKDRARAAGASVKRLYEKWRDTN